MTYGTSYFVSKAAAVRYYRAYEGANAAAAVARKIREGEIHIGRPPVKAGERISLIDGGKRYAISNPASGKKLTKAQKKAKARKASVERRVASALAGFLKKVNPAMKTAGASIQRLKGGVIKITPIKRGKR